MSDSVFCFQPTLLGPALALKPLRESDYSQMYACAADKEIWAGHPAHDSYKEEVFRVMFDDAISSTACVVISATDTGKLIGWSRYYVAEDGPNDISIGFTFITRRHWGGKSNREVKTLMLNYAFKFFNRVWFHISPDNYRSQKATQKLGAVFIQEQLLCLAGTQGIWRSYAIDKQQWSTHSLDHDE